MKKNYLFKLSAVLTLPKGAKKVPVVILVHGSGPNDRDEAIGPNKPFREFAQDFLGDQRRDLGYSYP